MVLGSKQNWTRGRMPELTQLFFRKGLLQAEREEKVKVILVVFAEAQVH